MISSLISVISSFLFPLFPSIFVMYVIIFFIGISNGCVDTTGNLWVKLIVWKSFSKKSFNIFFSQLDSVFMGMMVNLIFIFLN